MHNHSLHCHVHAEMTGVGENDPSVKARLMQAQKTCQKNGWRMTALREQVFEIILRATTPIGAYEILAILQQQAFETDAVHLDTNLDTKAPLENLAPTKSAQSKPVESKSFQPKKAKPIAPPTVYRSLDFLIEHGFVHQLNSANAYIPCCHPREQHIVAFLICQQCQKVEEFSADSIKQMLTSVGEQADFAVQRSVIEILGVCSACRSYLIA